MSVKQEALDHYERMQKWVKTQPGGAWPSMLSMRDAIGENWDGGFCSYCKRYGSCRDCPLYIDSPAKVACCAGLWFDMSNSRTWNEWFERSMKVVAYIKEHG